MTGRVVRFSHARSPSPSARLGYETAGTPLRSKFAKRRGARSIYGGKR